MTKAVSFSELADLVNVLAGQSIEPQPALFCDVSSKRHWSIHRATVQVGNQQVEYEILYVSSECSADSLERAAVYFRANPSETRQVVYTITAGRKSALYSLLETLGRGKQQSVKEYLFAKFKSQTDRYRAQVQKIRAEHFVEPSWKVEDHGALHSPKDYLELATRGNEIEGTLGVITGDPGQGKTYLAWKLVELAIAIDVLPIFVDSEQWRQMAPDDFENLGAVIAHSFRSYGVTFDIPTDKADKYIEIFLRAGVFAVIFDGFDEYVLRNHARTSGVEALSALQQLCQSTHAPILITSRSTFWVDLVRACKGEEGRDMRCIRWSLEPFDVKHAEKYFERRFPGRSDQSQRAVKLFRTIKSVSEGYGESDLVGRGFFLPLLHHLVDRSSSTDHISPQIDGWAPTHWIVEHLCKREAERQELVKADVQIAILKRVAISHFAEISVTSMQLFEWLYDLGISKQIIDELIGSTAEKGTPRGKLRDHPLLAFDDQKKAWVIKHHSIARFLLASHIIDKLTSGDSPQLGVLLEQTGLRGDPIATQDVLLSVVDLYHERHAESKLERIRNVVRKALEASPGAIEQSESIRWLCTNLCVVAVDTIFRNATPEKRTLELAGLFPSTSIESAVFSGQVSKFDFRNTMFASSIFERVVWSSCKFSSDTIFVDCEFTGGRIISSTGLGAASFESCRFDEAADICVARERIYAKAKNYSRSDLERDLGMILRKLAPTDSQRPKVKASTLFSGTVGLTLVQDQALHVMKKHLIDELSAEGRADYFRLKDSANLTVTFFRGNGAHIGVVRDALDDLESICLKIAKQR